MPVGAATGNETFAHAALVYDDDEQLLDAALPFLRGGVDAGEATLLSVSERELGVITAALGTEHGVTVVPPWPPTAAFGTLRRNHELINEHAGAADRVRIFGVMPPSGESGLWGGWVRYETAVNQLYADLPVSVLCPYDRRRTPPHVLADIAMTHTVITDHNGDHDPNPNYTEPSRMLANLADRDIDPLETEPPAIELIDQQPGANRRAVAALATTVGLDEHAIESLVLAVGEIITNAILYGRPPVSLRAWAGADRVVAAIQDHGPGPDDPFVGMLPVSTAEPGGLGLHVAYQACTLLTMTQQPDDFTVHLTVRGESSVPVVH